MVHRIQGLWVKWDKYERQSIFLPLHYWKWYIKSKKQGEYFTSTKVSYFTSSTILVKSAGYFAQKYFYRCVINPRRKPIIYQYTNLPCNSKIAHFPTSPSNLLYSLCWLVSISWVYGCENDKKNILYLFIYMTGVICHTQEYIIYPTVGSNSVVGNQERQRESYNHQKFGEEPFL